MKKNLIYGGIGVFVIGMIILVFSVHTGKMQADHILHAMESWTEETSMMITKECIHSFRVMGGIFSVVGGLGAVLAGVFYKEQ